LKKLLYTLLFVSATAFADCPELYPNSKPIRVENTVELCNSFYVSVYDEVNRKVVVVSERLKKGASVGAADSSGSFRVDPRVKDPVRTSEYTNSGYDRGHMAAADNGIDVNSVRETYFMTNVVPQYLSLNRGSWRVLESEIRATFLISDADVFVVTIPIYNDDKKVGTIPVPTAFWKIVIINGVEKYFYADNTINAVKEYSKIGWAFLIRK